MAISNSTITRVLGIDVKFENFNLGQALYLPQRIIIIGQGRSDAVYSLDKKQVFAAGPVGAEYGYGSPLHLSVKQLLPDNNDGVQGIPVTLIPLEDDGSGVEADGEITAVGTATASGVINIKLGGVLIGQVVIAVGDAEVDIVTAIKAAIDASLDVPVLSGVVALGVLPMTSKWAGESANDILIDIEQINGAGITMSTTPFANGAVNPDVDAALAKIGNIWEPFILNCLNYDDVVTAEKYRVYGEGRWNQLVKKPLVVINGCVDDFATRTAITDARKTDRVNFLGQSTGSKELPFVIAARALAKDIVPTANDRPAKNYEGLLSGLVAGPDDEQEDTAVADAAKKLGASTNDKIDGVARLRDTVTYYHPDGETIPAYRNVVTIIKLMQIVFNLEVILTELQSNPLAPDSTVSADPDLVQPKDVLTLFGILADNLAGGRSAIIVDAEFTKQNAVASINDQNPNRLDSKFPVKLSGNVEVNSNDLAFGFFFGGNA